MKKFPLEIVSPYRKVFSQEVDALTVPTIDGRIGLLPGHMPLFAVLKEGEIVIRVNEDKYFLAIYEGYVHVAGGSVQILVSRAIYGREVDEHEVRQAITHAHEMMRQASDRAGVLQAHMLLRRSFLQLKVMEGYRAHYHHHPLGTSQ